MGLDARKPVFGGLRTTQAQASLRFRAVWSAPLLIAFGKYHIKASYKRNFNFLASLCSWAGWSESHFVGNPEDRFSCYKAQIRVVIKHQFCYFSNKVSLGTHKKCLNETVLLSTQWYFVWEITKLMFNMQTKYHWVLKRNVSMRQFFWVPSDILFEK